MDFKEKLEGLKNRLKEKSPEDPDKLGEYYETFRNELSEFAGENRESLHERSEGSCTNAYSVCLQYIAQAEALDLLVPPNRNLHGWRTRNSSFFSQNLLLAGWESLAQCQRDTGNRIYRATLAHHLGMYALGDNDPARAIWWLLHTQADDAFDNVEGHGWRDLRSNFQVSSNLKDTLQQLAPEPSDWKSPAGFAEDVVRRLVLKHPEHSYLFAHQSSSIEFPISNPYFEALLDAAKKQDTSSQEKGDSLETLATYLFMLIPGWIPHQKVSNRTFENDLMVENLSPHSNLMADMLGRQFIVECKNWKDPVGVQAVGYFIHRMRLTHSSFGVLLSREGITGEQDSKAATDLVKQSFHEDNVLCVVLNEKDLDNLQKGNTTFRALLITKVSEIKYGKTSAG